MNTVPTKYSLMVLVLLCVGGTSFDAFGMSAVKKSCKYGCPSVFTKWFGAKQDTGSWVDSVYQKKSSLFPSFISTLFERKLTKERFFAELKNPTNNILRYLQTALREDVIDAESIDVDTLLSPVDLMFSRYEDASPEEQKHYRALCKYLLFAYSASGSQNDFDGKLKEHCFAELNNPTITPDGEFKFPEENLILFVSSAIRNKVISPDTVDEETGLTAVELIFSRYYEASVTQQELYRTLLKEKYDDLYKYQHLADGKSMSKKEVADWFKDASAGSSLDKNAPTSDSYFAALKNPTEDTLEFVKRAVTSSKFYRDAVDKETLCTPSALIVSLYADASDEQKGYYRDIFKYLLEVDTICSANLQHSKPLTIDPNTVKELEELYATLCIGRNVVSWDAFLGKLTDPTPEMESKINAIPFMLFFKELKKPTKFSLNVIESLIESNNLFRYVVDAFNDKATGCRPTELIISRYAAATPEEQGYYREMFECLLKAGTNCVITGSGNPIEVDMADVTDLKVLYTASSVWKHRIAWETIFGQVGVPVQSVVSPHNVSPDVDPIKKKEETSFWKYALGVTVVAITGYLLKKSYDTTETKANERQKMPNYTSLFVGAKAS